MNPSNDQSFHELNQEVKKLTKKLFRQSFTHLRTGPNQLTYELQDDEIFARALNQHYLRT